MLNGSLSPFKDSTNLIRPVSNNEICPAMKQEGPELISKANVNSLSLQVFSEQNSPPLSFPFPSDNKTRKFVKITDSKMEFRGFVENNKKNGPGTEINQATGIIYIGDFVNDKKEGYGIQQYSTGDKYVGQWKDNKQSGNGTMRYITGDEYCGSWKEGKRSGFGVYFYSNVGVYTGEWQAGKRHGKGELSVNGVINYSGNWFNDKPDEADKQHHRS